MLSLLRSHKQGLLRATLSSKDKEVDNLPCHRVLACLDTTHYLFLVEYPRYVDTLPTLNIFWDKTFPPREIKESFSLGGEIIP